MNQLREVDLGSDSIMNSLGPRPLLIAVLIISAQQAGHGGRSFREIGQLEEIGAQLGYTERLQHGKLRLQA